MRLLSLFSDRNYFKDTDCLVKLVYYKIEDVSIFWASNQIPNLYDNNHCYQEKNLGKFWTEPAI